MSARAEYRPVAPRVDVPAVVAALNLDAERRGKEYWARCPLPEHRERTPSWSILSKPGRPGNGYHKCWGCGFEGGVVELVMTVVGLNDWRFAVDWLYERGFVAGESAPSGVRLSSVGGFRRSTLKKPEGVVLDKLGGWLTPARRYAVSRGLTAEQVERWDLGYACDGEMAGRLYIPAHSRDGRLASYTGRAMFGQEPRYRDAEGSAGVDHSVVFGERYWPADCSAATLVLCEGELNALACERAGAAHVGALGSSGLHREQNLKIASFGRVLVATDVDKAGSKAALHLRAALARWRNVKRVEFPPGLDARDVEQHQGLAALRGLLWGSS